MTCFCVGAGLLTIATSSNYCFVQYSLLKHIFAHMFLTLFASTCLHFTCLAYSLSVEILLLTYISVFLQQFKFISSFALIIIH